jgi:superfamily II DNA helicase RecQ
MLAFAETRTCRRATMLHHFGDDSPAVSDGIVCCDICAAALPADTSLDRPAETATERAALVVLDTVENLGWGVGKAKLAQLLKGAPALDGTGYVRARNYGKLAALRLADIEELVGELLVGGYLQTTGGSRPVLGLTARGERAVHGRLAVAVGAVSVGKGSVMSTRPAPPPYRTMSAPSSPIGASPSPAYNTALSASDSAERAPLGNTVLETGRLLTAGHKPEHIAAARGLTLDTVYTHLAQLIAEGQADLNAVVPASLQAQVRAAIAKTGRLDRLAPIKSHLPSSIGYGVIRCVVAAEQRAPSAAAPGSVTKPPEAPPPARPTPAPSPAAPAPDAVRAAARERAARSRPARPATRPACRPSSPR